MSATGICGDEYRRHRRQTERDVRGMLNGKIMPEFDVGKDYTYGERLHPLQYIETEEEAVEYKRRLLAHQEQYGVVDGMTPEQVVNGNIGYWTGYYDEKTAQRIKRLFQVAHPIFG